MLNVGEIIDDPDFAQDFKVNRKTVTLVGGRVDISPETLNYSGVVVPTNPKELIQTPEGDIVTGTITVYTTDKLNTTLKKPAVAGAGYISDEIVWQGENWKILSCNNYSDYGFFKSIAIRKLGA